MRELCIEDLAMSTRVALPMFLGCRMSELRRHLVPSPTPSQDHSAQEAQVRRNLFGPIDHEENLKFVQDELAKITKCDRKKWNYDFEADKPLEGRYHWEPVKEGVPQAYEMPRLDYLSTTTSSSTISSTSTTTTSSVSSPSVSCVPECSTTTIKTSFAPPKNTVTSSTTSTQTSDKPTCTQTSIPNQPSCSSDTKSSETVVVRENVCNNTKAIKRPIAAVRNSRSKAAAKSPSSAPSNSSQPKLTAFMRIKKRAAPTKRDDDQPPALVKRPKTTTS